MSDQLTEFVCESNRIEGIVRLPTADEVRWHEDLLRQEWLVLPWLKGFVAGIAEALLRDKEGMDVRVGAYLPPRGGAHVREALDDLLYRINDADSPVDRWTRRLTPFSAHVEYEQLHPFMDGNGRSGRAIWAWQMRRDGFDPFSLPFLHRFYYQALDASRSSSTGRLG